MNCHPDPSVAKRRACPERSRMGTCCSLYQHPIHSGALPFLCHPGESLLDFFNRDDNSSIW